MNDYDFSTADIQHIFRMKGTKQTLFNAEERGDIPLAKRVQKGRVATRQWSIDQLPAIGKKFGFLDSDSLDKQEIIAIYTAKGGVLKSTLTYSLARLFALHGHSCLIIGLDIQGSITELALNPLAKINSIEDLPQYKGLYDFFSGDCSLEDTILHTNIPTLDIIPETPGLGPLEKLLRDKKRREYVIKEKVISKLKDYDIIFIDNGPSWNMLIENSLTSATTVLSPVGCDLGSYQALQTNLDSTLEFKEDMNLKWKNFFLVPTLLDNTKLSKQIYGAYLNTYSDKITEASIRRAVKGQESLALGKTILEHDPLCPLAQDYIDLSQEIWAQITGRGEK